jgi:predicted O-methyltransferase YrrM
LQALKRLLRAALRVVLPVVMLPLAPVFALAARTGIGVELCRRFGFHPVRLHFYQPVPRYEDVPPEQFGRVLDAPGVDVDLARAETVLARLAPFGAECRWPDAAGASGTYYAMNENFGFSSAALLHAMIRAHGTRRVVEVGSGFSSLIAMAALRANGGDWRFSALEPHPSPWLREAIAAAGSHARLLAQTAQSAAPGLFDELQQDDLLFIDSSHVSKLYSDVNTLFLQVLPRLRPGVLVHVHDIYLPYEYPAEHFFGANKMFWNEQYLLQAFLACNPHFEVLLPGFHVQSALGDAFGRAFPAFDPARHRKTSSFWFRRKPA